MAAACAGFVNIPGATTNSYVASTADRNATIDVRVTATNGDGTTALIGSPGSVAERLEELRQELELDGVLMELNCGGRIPHANVMTALRLLCQEVMPEVH